MSDHDDLTPLPDPQPCDLGCTVIECPVGCDNGYVEDVDINRRPMDFPCPVCRDAAPVPAVHASVDECHPPLPEGWRMWSGDWSDDEEERRPWLWSIYPPGDHHAVREGKEPTESERDRALWGAVRDIARQEADR